MISNGKSDETNLENSLVMFCGSGARPHIGCKILEQDLPIWQHWPRSHAISYIWHYIIHIYIYTYIVYNILSKSVYYISSWFWMLCASLCCLPDASLVVFAPIWLLWHGKKHLGGLPQGLLRLKLWEPWTHEPSQTLLPSCGSGFNISIIICLQFLRLSSLVPNKPLIPNHPSSTSGQVCDASKMEGSIAPAQIQESSRACFFFSGWGSLR